MQIFVKNLSGKSIAIDIETTSRVSELKEAILEKDGIPPDSQRLIYAGRQLEDGRKLGDYNITESMTVHLTSRLEGGVN